MNRAAVLEIQMPVRKKDMKAKKFQRLLIATAVGALCASAAMADDDAYWYGAFAAGQSRVRIDENRITEDLLAGGLATTQFTRNQTHFAWEVFGGYHFNKYFALESGYFNLGKFSFTSVTAPPGKLSGEIKVHGREGPQLQTRPDSEFSFIRSSMALFILHAHKREFGFEAQ